MPGAGLADVEQFHALGLRLGETPEVLDGLIVEKETAVRPRLESEDRLGGGDARPGARNSACILSCRQRGERNQRSSAGEQERTQGEA